MKRLASPPRADWQARCEKVGFPHHSPEGKTYWDESVCYEFSAAQVDAIEEAAFLHRVEEFLSIHCQIATQSQPLTSQAQIDNILAGQQNYCARQQQNDKTRRVLEKSFGTEWADRYMTTMLFDYVGAERSTAR